MGFSKINAIQLKSFYIPFLLKLLIPSSGCSSIFKEHPGQAITPLCGFLQ